MTTYECPIHELDTAMRNVFEDFGPNGSRFRDVLPLGTLQISSTEIPWEKFRPDVKDQYPDNFEFDRSRWVQISNVSRDWSCGPDDRSKVRGGTGGDLSNPKHFHCDIVVDGETLHIDYVAHFNWGPFFCAFKFTVSHRGELAAQSGSGCRAWVGGPSKNEPCAVRIGSHLLVLSRAFSTCPDKHDDGISVWRCDDDELAN